MKVDLIFKAHCRVTWLFALLACGLPAAAQTVLPDEVIIAADSVPDEATVKALPLPADALALPYVSPELIEDRLGCLQNAINLEYNPTIQSFIEFFVVRRRDYTKMVLARKDYYFSIYEPILKKYNMPDELKYLSIVESGLNPRAVSRVGATGPWQFMSYTGREMRLHQDAYVDERLDPHKSTEAACRYLRQLYDLFGDWELALASYNCGPGNVRRAIRRSGNKTSFWEIYNYLPRETRSYVPQFVAVAYVMNYAEDYNLRPDNTEPRLDADTVLVNRYLNLELLAKQLNTPLEALQKLNPHLKRNAVPRYLKNYPVRIPSSTHAYFVANRAAILDSADRPSRAEMQYLADSPADQDGRATRVRLLHKVRRGEAITRVASKYNVTVAQLKDWNRLRSSKLQSGQRLFVWLEPRPAAKRLSDPGETTVARANPTAEDSTAIPATTPVVAHVADRVGRKVEATSETGEESAPSARPVSKTIRRKLTHTVRRGEGLYAVADHYGVGAAQIREWNRLKSNNLRAGQRLAIWEEKTVRAPGVKSNAPAVAKATETDQPAENTQTTRATAAPLTDNAQTDAEVVNAPRRENRNSRAELTSQVEAPVLFLHKVRKGEGLITVAAQYRLPVARLREWNNLATDELHIGQKLAIRADNTSRASLAVAEARERVDRKLVHTVQRGDTLWSISKQYGNIPVETIKKLNNLRGNEVKAGQKLILG